MESTSLVRACVRHASAQCSTEFYLYSRLFAFKIVEVYENPHYYGKLYCLVSICMYRVSGVSCIIVSWVSTCVAYVRMRPGATKKALPARGCGVEWCGRGLVHEATTGNDLARSATGTDGPSIAHPSSLRAAATEYSRSGNSRRKTSRARRV